jgi:uncharacterized protein YndB with AHSA1/START domain
MKIGLIVLGFVVAGTGCLKKAEAQSPADAALALDLTPGTVFMLEQTAFGFGGKLLSFVGVDQTQWQATVTTVIPGQQIELVWKQLGSDPPVHAGTLTSTGLSNATQVLFPEDWPDGETVAYADNALLWLSRLQYDALGVNGSTEINLGKLDASLMEALAATRTVTDLLDAVDAAAGTSLAPDTKDVQEKNFFLVTKERDDTQWIRVDGALHEVQTVVASNWFATYEILANPEHPLILSVRITPFANKAFDEASLTALAQSFAGYEVQSILYNPSLF